MATFVQFNTSEGKELAVAEGFTGFTQGAASTVVILPEHDVDGLTAGQLAFKHNVPQGTEPGTYSHC